MTDAIWGEMDDMSMPRIIGELSRAQRDTCVRHSSNERGSTAGILGQLNSVPCTPHSIMSWSLNAPAEAKFRKLKDSAVSTIWRTRQKVGKMSMVDRQLCAKAGACAQGDQKPQLHMLHRAKRIFNEARGEVNSSLESSSRLARFASLRLAHLYMNWTGRGWDFFMAVDISS